VILLLRRAVVKGELGGSTLGRTVSCIALCSLWLIYIIMSTLQAYGLAGLGDVSIGNIPEQDLTTSVQYWLVQCDKITKYDTKSPAFIDLFNKY